MEDKMRNLVKVFLSEIGEDAQRPGLIETPRRVSKMISDLFYGYDIRRKPKITTFTNGKDGVVYDQMIFDTGTFCSFCEHHILPFYGRYWFAYIPNSKGLILGLSKVARIVDYYSARLQVQERLVTQIADELWNTLSTTEDGKKPIGMGLAMEGEHLCKTIRGAKKTGTMKTICLRGEFYNPGIKAEFLSQIK